MLKKIISTVFIIAFLSFSYYNNFRDLVIEKLSAYKDNAPEKIYIQTDKPYYAIGEDIWFSAYLVNGISHEPSIISNVIYVELLNEKDSIVDKKQLLLTDVSTGGDFKLKRNWQPGKYKLRAYSNYMRNDSTDYFFKTVIPIVNILENNSTKTQEKIKLTGINPSSNNNIPKLGFYPESGYLINNIPTTVSIKVDGKFKNTKLKGSIKDSDGQEITTFETYKFGLGIIKLTPEPNKNYYASITVNSKEIKYPLPKALTEGYHLEITNAGKQLLVNVSSNTSQGLKNTLLIAHQRGKLIYENLQKADTSSYKIRIDTKFLNDGTTNFTLFNTSGLPVCERLVFIDNPYNNINVNLVLDKNTPTVRDKVFMKVTLTDSKQQLRYGKLSMAITDIDAVQQNTASENIETYLLLNSDLIGHIESPGYFFQKKNDPRRRFLLDLTMLTHGWRRFKWEELLYGSKDNRLKYEAERGIYISGKTKALKGNRKQLSAATRLSFMGKIIHQETQQSSTSGKFKYGPYIFQDTLNAIIEARVKDFQSDNEESNRFIDIQLDNQLKNSHPIQSTKHHKKITSIKLDSVILEKYIRKTKQQLRTESEFSKANTVLDEVLILAENKAKQRKRNDELDKRTFYGTPTQRLDMNDYEDQRAYNIIDILNQLPSVRAFDDSISIRNQGQPIIMVDGQIVLIDDILFLIGEEVEFVDVLNAAEAAIPNANNGVISIYTRTGSFSSNKNVKQKPGIVNFTVNGFYTAREFYAPDYNDEFEAFKNYKDQRTTLHWEPKIKLTPNSDEATVSFFTGDTKSNYAIKVEGITDEGVPFYHLSTFEVN